VFELEFSDGFVVSLVVESDLGELGAFVFSTLLFGLELVNSDCFGDVFKISFVLLSLLSLFSSLILS